MSRLRIDPVPPQRPRPEVLPAAPARPVVLGSSLARSMRLLGIGYPELWTRYAAAGGRDTVEDVRRHIESRACPDVAEHQRIAQALDEMFSDRHVDRPAVYSHLHRHRDRPTTVVPPMPQRQDVAVLSPANRWLFDIVPRGHPPVPPDQEQPGP